MAYGKISYKGPSPIGKMNSQTLGAAAIRSMAKAGVGNPTTASKGTEKQQQDFDSAFAKAFNLPTTKRGSKRGSNQAASGSTGASAGRPAGKSTQARKPGAGAGPGRKPATPVRVTSIRAPASKPKKS